MSNRNVESDHFHQFRELVEELPGGEVFHRDAPDFLIRLPTETLGIEFTRVFKPSLSSAAPEAALDNTAESLVLETRNLARACGMPGLLVRLYFNLRMPIKRAEREHITRNIAALIDDNIPEIGSTVTLEYGLGCDSRHPHIVDVIQISRVSEIGRDDWARGDAVRVEVDTISIFQSAIDEKAGRLDSYLMKCDRCWLVLSAEFMKPAQAIFPDSTSASCVYASPFERTYFLNCTRNAVWQLNTTVPTVR